MGLIKSAADLAYTFRFLALLVTPFNKTKAFEKGIMMRTVNVLRNLLSLLLKNVKIMQTIILDSYDLYLISKN